MVKRHTRLQKTCIACLFNEKTIQQCEKNIQRLKRLQRRAKIVQSESVRETSKIKRVEGVVVNITANSKFLHF